MLTIVLLASFSSVSYADTVGNTPVDSQTATTGKQPSDATDAAKNNVANPSVTMREPVKDEFSVGNLVLGFIVWSFMLFVIAYVYGQLTGTLKKARLHLMSISMTLSIAATVLMMVNKLSTYPMNALSGLSGWWLAQCGFIYLLFRLIKK